jgi:hypothetical protein
MTSTQPFSPRYNDSLDIKHIVVRTGYNNRALSKKECVDAMRSAMNNFEIYIDEVEEQFVEDGEEYISTSQKYGEVYIVHPEEHIRLLYTNHSGYTWIDQDITGSNPSYYNENDITYVNSTRELLKNDGVNDSGCFIFELSENANTSFCYLLEFANNLTNMKFCGFFCMSCLHSVMYHPNSKTIFFNFDTESG